MNQIKSITFILLTATFILFASNAIAGPYSDEMAKCLVESTSDEEKNQLVKWIFSAASLHPSLTSISSITPSDREAATKTTAELFMKLLTDTCREQTKKAIKYEGPQSIGFGFEVLGRVAAQGLFSSPAVANEIASLDNYVDKQKLEELGLDQ